MKKSLKTAMAGWAGGIYIIIGEICDFLGIETTFATDGVFSVDTLVIGLTALGIAVTIKSKKASDANS